MDVIVTSRQSIENDANGVQAFHDAWFDTLKAQVEEFDTAAAQIADWGHNDWSFVYPESAEEDLVLWLENVAQADLSDNILVMRDPEPIEDRLETARRVWAASGLEVPGAGSSLLTLGLTKTLCPGLIKSKFPVWLITVFTPWLGVEA